MKTEWLEISDLTGNSTIPIMESFYTIQGEGFHTGSSAWFIRTGGCDVGCVWCDVKESWDAAAHPPVKLAEIVKEAGRSATDIIVITGGEPMMYDMDILTRALRSGGKKVHVETSGAHALSGEWDWVCFSPKKFMAPREEYYKIADELKVVVYNKSDFQWAEEHASRIHPDAKLYLQPEWSKREVLLPEIIDYIKENPKWRISLQTHKYMNIP